MSNELGTLIKNARDLKGFTLIDVSKKSGISIAQLSRIETGKRGAPKPDTLKKISLALDISFNELMIMAGHINEDDNEPLKRIDHFNLNSDLDEKIKHVAAMLTDEKGLFFSYLQEDAIEIFKNIQINEESTAFFEIYERGVNEFKDDPLTLNEITEGSFNLVCNFEVLSEIILEKLSYEEKEILLKELTSIAKKHELYKEDENDIKDLEEFLNQPEISFNGKPISQELKQRILGYAEALTDQDK
ncbi:MULTISPECIES: helix-turn-helix domain-containing protein [unclassified Paenibacillus]|uniref:helix-turn-helix domain-containing protein n=1 Tax=unclassified Paenibacillus TaxID=185978 RepID=UPI00031BF83E|nr:MULTISPECIES: helix-turn-helix domain-containing protein [unclassified Paenibacillus]ETT32655.1 helix-turn-helix domain-containing protein [Paenibacillus sp. FSL R5-192]